MVFNVREVSEPTAIFLRSKFCIYHKWNARSFGDYRNGPQPGSRAAVSRLANRGGPLRIPLQAIVWSSDHKRTRSCCNVCSQVLPVLGCKQLGCLGALFEETNVGYSAMTRGPTSAIQVRHASLLPIALAIRTALPRWDCGRYVVVGWLPVQRTRRPKFESRKFWD